MKVVTSAQKTKTKTGGGGGEIHEAHLKRKAGARCLDGGVMQRWWPSEAPSTPSINWQVLKEPSLNRSPCSWLDWQLLEVGKEHRAMDGWLVSKGPASVCHLSFLLEFTTGWGVKREQQLEQRGEKLLHHSLGSGCKTDTWVFSDKVSYHTLFYFFVMRAASHLITYYLMITLVLVGSSRGCRTDCSHFLCQEQSQYWVIKL